MTAIFEGWLDSNRKDVIARGPFEVEIYSDESGRKTRFRARVIPGRHLLMVMNNGKAKPIENKKIDDTQRAVELIFQKKLKDWSERVTPTDQ